MRALIAVLVLAAAGAAASAIRGDSRLVTSSTSAVAHFIRLGQPVYCGRPRHGRAIALTFDDGPGPRTLRVLRLLSRWKARATFFLIGGSVPGRDRTVRRELRLGTVGDHTWTHPLLTALSSSSIHWQLAQTKTELQRVTRRRIVLFRPPYGAHNATVDRQANALGLLEVLWSIDSRDSLGADARTLSRNVLRDVQPGSIILMHENDPETAKVLGYVLRVLVHRRFKLVTVPELLSLDPPSAAQVRAGLTGCRLP